HFIAEVLDPDSHEPVAEGEVGELVLTAPTKQAFPLLRYRTRDRTRLEREACACGRTSVRLARILGRTDDMLIVRGVNVFPSQIEHALVGARASCPSPRSCSAPAPTGRTISASAWRRPRSRGSPRRSPPWRRKCARRCTAPSGCRCWWSSCRRGP